MILSQHLATTAAKAGTNPAFIYLDQSMSWPDFRARVGRLSYLAHRVLEWVLLDDFRAPAACT